SPLVISPPDRCVAWPSRDCVQPCFASASSSSKSAGIPSVTWSTPTASSSFGTEKTRSTSALGCTGCGAMHRGAAAELAKTSALQTEMTSDDHTLNLIRALSDLQNLLV